MPTALAGESARGWGPPSTTESHVPVSSDTTGPSNPPPGFSLSIGTAKRRSVCPRWVTLSNVDSSPLFSLSTGNPSGPIPSNTISGSRSQVSSLPVVRSMRNNWSGLLSASSTANHPPATPVADLAHLACRGVQSPERAPAPAFFVAAACEPDGLLTESRDDQWRSAIGGVHDLVRPGAEIDDVEAHFPWRLVADRIWVPAQQLSVRVPEAVV